MAQEEIVFNKFCRVLNEWIALHDEEHFFPKHRHMPQISYRKGAQYIHANEAFEKLDNNLRECLVAHEIGHRELHQGQTDVQKMLNNILRSSHILLKQEKVVPNELEADEFAANMLGYPRYIAALEELRDMSLVEGFIESAHELHLRAEHLRARVN